MDNKPLNRVGGPYTLLGQFPQMLDGAEIVLTNGCTAFMIITTAGPLEYQDLFYAMDMIATGKARIEVEIKWTPLWATEDDKKSGRPPYIERTQERRTIRLNTNLTRPSE